MTFSIMFHHFSSEVHPASQGALCKEDFEEMLDWLQYRYNLLDAKHYQRKAKEGKLKSYDICLSFDDALACQYDVAFPVLLERGITAFYFIYSAPILGEVNYLEVFRYFRETAYSSVDVFYEDFFLLCKEQYPEMVSKAMEAYDANSFLQDYRFYTPDDRWFRYLRDVALENSNYEDLMLCLMDIKKFQIDAIRDKLWMKEWQVKEIHSADNVIGLHSYSHPTRIDLLSFSDQRCEYQKNSEHLEGVVNESATTMAHPCGKFNVDTFRILKELGVDIGFISSMNAPKRGNLLGLPREDHANVFAEMKK